MWRKKKGDKMATDHEVTHPKRKKKHGGISCKPHIIRPLRGCPICGSKMVMIRGKYPKEKKRKICPTCAQERLDDIHTISDKDYGKAYQSNGG